MLSVSPLDVHPFNPKVSILWVPLPLHLAYVSIQILLKTCLILLGDYECLEGMNSLTLSLLQHLAHDRN